jgi:hypothetical protein
MKAEIKKILFNGISFTGQENFDRDIDNCAERTDLFVMEFAEWCINGVVKLYYRDEKYNILGTKLSLKSMEELYQYWLKNVKHA